MIAAATALERPAIRGGLDDADGDVAVLVDGEPAPDFRVDSDWRALRELTAQAETAYDPVPLTGRDPAIQAYTSGSTGDPKGVVLTQRGVRWCTDSFREFLEITQDERGLVVTPLYHKNAMTGVVKPCLAAGASCVVLPEFERETVIETIETYEVTYLTGVPAIFKRLVEAPALVAASDTASLSWASCGSATVPETLAGQFEDVFDATLLEVYGLTEGGPVVTHSPRDGPQKAGSAGLALPGCRTRVVDPETGEAVADGNPGELLVSNPGLGSYDERPAAERAAFEIIDGTRWLHTGDLARKDEDGYHFILGRLDDMMIVGGENLYPADVEERVLQHDAVTDVAVVSVPHDTKGEAPVAFVVTDRPVTAAAVKQFALDRGPAFAHPRRVFVVDAIPLSGTGKADTETLRQRALERIDGSL
nr:long-chain fatty acid--CoA ligase [Halomicroarcula sp. SYNS111]